MDKYNWLMRKQTSALKVFEEARKSLQKVQIAMFNEMVACTGRIQQHDEGIKIEREAIQYLEEQRAKIESQTQKISSILE